MNPIEHDRRRQLAEVWEALCRAYPETFSAEIPVRLPDDSDMVEAVTRSAVAFVALYADRKEED